jgi:hypothetical protein
LNGSVRRHAVPAGERAPAAGAGSGPLRLRIGLLLVVLSWLPVAQLVIWLAGLSGERAGEVRIAVWSGQILVGFVGVAVAGAAAATVVRSVGWRRAPGALWRMLCSGRLPAPT